MAGKQRGSMEFSFSTGPDTGSRRIEDRPFSILVVGDFSGRGGSGERPPLAQRRPLAVDVDELDNVMARLKVALQFPPDASSSAILDLPFSQLDDFHPDQIYAKAPVFARLRELRQKIQNPATFEAAAAEVRSWADTRPDAPAQTPSTAPSPAPAAADAGASPFAQLMDKRVSPHAASKTRYSADPKIDEFIGQIVKPHVVASKDPDQDDLLSAVDKATSRHMNAILHHADFQALEATWRGLDFLIHNLETDENLTLQMLHVSRDEMATDLMSGNDLRQSQLYRVLVKEARLAPGGVPWALVVGLYTFRKNESDAALLRRWGELAAAAGAPFMAGSEYAPGDEDAGGAGWRELLAGQAADHVALAVPRMLLRLPYGPDTESVESFPFNEMDAQPVHAAYLWGNPAVACACLIGQTFSESGWSMRLGSIDRLGGLPLHVWTEDGEKNMTPPAEFWLTDADAEGLIARGLIPLCSVRGSDAIAIPRFLSVSGRAIPLGPRS